MPSSPYLLLLPGLACDFGVWKRQAYALAGVTTLSVASYGLSDSLDEMARAALKYAPRQRFALAGHSMGARVAFEIIRRVPERVVGLAILDSACKPRSAGEAGERESQRRSTLLKIAQTQGMRAMALEWLPGIVHPARLTDQPLVDSIVEMICRKTPEIFAAQIKALLERPDAAPVLKSVRCPTLVLCGREDTWSPLAGHREMAALVPGSKLVVIENSGHMSPMERPEDVTAALTAWFSGLDR